MSKEMQLLESKMAFYKRMINELDVLNYVTGPNKYYSEEIEDYQVVKVTYVLMNY